MLLAASRWYCSPMRLFQALVPQVRGTFWGRMEYNNGPLKGGDKHVRSIDDYMSTLQMAFADTSFSCFNMSSTCEHVLRHMQTSLKAPALEQNNSAPAYAGQGSANFPQLIKVSQDPLTLCGASCTEFKGHICLGAARVTIHASCSSC